MKQEIIDVIAGLAESIRDSHTLVSDGTWPKYEEDAKQEYEYLIDLIERYESEE